MKPIVPHPDAFSEFHRDEDYYESRTAGAGVAYREAIERSIEKIRDQPSFYPYWESTDCRECPVRGYPYAIYYMGFEDYIWIVAFANQRRRPGYWTKRLRTS